MERLTALLKLIPLLVATAIRVAHEIELGFTEVAQSLGVDAAGKGVAKMQVVEGALMTIQEEVTAAQSAIPIEKVKSIFTSLVGIVVKAFNTVGWFKKAAPAA